VISSFVCSMHQTVSEQTVGVPSEAVWIFSEVWQTRSRCFRINVEKQSKQCCVAPESKSIQLTPVVHTVLVQVRLRPLPSLSGLTSSQTAHLYTSERMTAPPAKHIYICELFIYMKSSDAKASKCHLKFSSRMKIFIKLVYLSSVISLKWQLIRNLHCPLSEITELK